MLIESGYWNYYLAFRIESYQKHLKEIHSMSENTGVLAYISDQTTLVKSTLQEMLENRKNGADMLEQAIQESIDQVRFFDFSYAKMLSGSGRGKCGYYVLMPLKLYVSDLEFTYCPVYIQLLTNGNGFIKLQVPLKNILSEKLSNYPIKKWYTQIEVWHELLEKDGDKRYKILKDEMMGIEDIMYALQKYVQNFFSESIVDRERFIALETVVIAESKNCDINKIGENDLDGIQQMYRLAYPENFAITPNEKELKEFWEKARFNANGVHVVCGERARLILYTDVEKMIKRNGRNDILSKNTYLNNSMAATFDPYLLLAMAQKDNEMTIFRLVESDRHTIKDRMKQYYANANYLDSIMLNVPKHGKIFYTKVRDMLDHSTADFKEMLQRIQNIEEYEKTRLTEKQNNSINRVTLIFTVLFGLPLIQETLLTVKTVLNVQRDLIPKVSTGQISFLIWILLIIALLVDIIERSLEYEGMSAKDVCLIFPQIIKHAWKRIKR